MRKPAIRNRSFQSHCAGKGSADRTSNDAAYRRNFDAIKWSNKRWVTPTAKDIPDTTKYKTPPTWDDELSTVGASPIGFATWDGYYRAVDRRGKD